MDKVEMDANVKVNIKKIVEAEDEEWDRGFSATGHVEQDQKPTPRNVDRRAGSDVQGPRSKR